nr:MAG TPA: hypothetical protein [Caudoviricetes sp.]
MLSNQRQQQLRQIKDINLIFLFSAPGNHRQQRSLSS